MSTVEQTTIPGAEAQPRKRQWSEARRRAELERRRRLMAERADRATLTEAVKPDLDLVADKVVGEAVDNVKAFSVMFLRPFLPYTAVTICGIEAPEGSPEGTPPLVFSRADLAGEALLEQTKRSPRLLRAIDRFNAVFRNMGLMEAVAGTIAAAAVDLEMVAPDAALRVPGPRGPVDLPVLAPVIGDVVQYMAQQEQLAQRLNRETQVAHLEPEPRRSRRREAPEPDGTVPREGQAVIEGGVTQT